MSLEQLVAEAKHAANHANNFCVVGIWGLHLNEVDKKVFIESMGDDDLSHRVLYNLYREAGATFGLTSLKEHRNGNCRCLL